MFRGNPPHLGYAQCAFALLLTLGLGLGQDVMALESRPPPLRVVVLPNAPSSLQTSQAARMITDFASSEGRKVEWSIATHPAELFARLTTNRSDLVVGSLPAELASSPSLVATERYVAVGRR
jgi:ABC-type phosphate/phosphonate transport system substrate-binding protein